MGRRKRLYPMNLLTELSLNQEMGTNIDYENLSEDQLAGLHYALSCLTERNRLLIREYYENYKSRRQLAETYRLPESYIRQCIARALRDFSGNTKMFSYITNGYQANMECLTRQLAEEEALYKQKRGICDKSHLFYQDVTALRFPARINTALRWTDIQTVRELLIWICAGFRIRNLGEISIERIFEKLPAENLLPANFQVEVLPNSLPRLNIEAEVFGKLNSYDI